MSINYDSSIPSDSDSDFEDELFEELVKKDVEEFLNEDDAISKKNDRGTTKNDCHLFPQIGLNLSTNLKFGIPVPGLESFSVADLGCLFQHS
jgi:hypothetical protein